MKKLKGLLKNISNMTKPKMREGWEKIFKLGDRISLEMAIDQNSNPQTKDSSKWTKFAPEEGE